jgi:hypothetical protein
MASISKTEAIEIAEAFHKASVGVGEFRFAHWGDISAAERKKLEDLQWTLLNSSNDFVTTAVGIALADLAATLDQLKKATAKAQRVIDTITTVNEVLEVAASFVVLAGAITARDPVAIVTAIGDLLDTAKDALS